MDHAQMILRLALRILVKLGYALLVAPWVVVSLVAAGLRRIDGVARLVVALPQIRASHAMCPRGHRSQTLGMWECRGCGGLYAGWAFQACPVCSSSCGHITCEHCGLAIRNPLL